MPAADTVAGMKYFNMKEMVIKKVAGAEAVDFWEENGTVTACMVTTATGQFLIELHGVPIERLLSDDMDWGYIKNNLCDIPKLVEEMSDWENVKGKIVPRFASNCLRSDRNYMDFVCHSSFFDLVLTFHVQLDEGHSATVNPSMLKKWDVTLEELEEVAWNNIAFTHVVEPVDKVLKESGMAQEGVELVQDTVPLYMLSNHSKEFGAVHMFDNLVLTLLCDRMGEEIIYIIPSSVHEVLLLPGSVGYYMDIDAMVKVVNSTLCDTEILSDHCYVYDATEDEFYCSKDEVMVCTYHIQYEGADGFGEIRFCAKTEAEAIELFNNWCIQDMKLACPAQITSIETVFDVSDAETYRYRYAC